MKPPILITGGAGFIGSSLALRLTDRGERVRVLDTLSPQVHGARPEESPLYLAMKDRVEFLRGSVCDPDAMRRALDGVHSVVHLAAETGTGQSMYAIRHYSDVNVGGTALLLDLIANEQVPIRRLVVASSRAVYGEGAYLCVSHGAVYPPPRTVDAMRRGDFELYCPHCRTEVEMIPTPEDAPLVPHSVYGVTKLTQEQLVIAVGRALGISAVALRYQNVYGPGQSLSNPYTGILSIFSTRIRNGNGINIFEDGRESRDFVYIDDVVEATLRVLDLEMPVVDIFNVGSGVATSVTMIADLLQRCLGISTPMEVSGQFRVGDIRHNVADLRRVRSALGYSPSITIEEGLRRFADWVGGEAVQVDRFEASLDQLRVRGLLG
ncbi:MAG: NAD-dependent epimerase/dehydratase family protein [Longimicrobiales bacterium]